MHSHIKIGRIAGIEIGLHFSWFLVAVLIALSLSAHFRAVNPEWRPAVVWSAAAITAVLFFVTLLLHELAHSLLAKTMGLRVRAITLFALGGVSQIESEAPTASSEFWIAIVGPATSFAVGIVLIAVARGGGWAPGEEAHTPTLAVLLWLGYINMALAAFNMIPGYPLDGGRVLRAILWWFSHSQERATRWASQVGQGVGFLLIFFGLYRYFMGAGFGGLWIAFIGWFLLDAARASYMQAGILSGLRGRTVGDLMERNCPAVPGYLSVRDFVDEYLLHSASRCFLVASNEQVVGVVTPIETRKVPRDEWDQASIQGIMERLDQLHTVAPEMPATRALELMARRNIHPLAVKSQGSLQGIFSQSQVLRFLHVNSDTEGETQSKRVA